MEIVTRIEDKYFREELATKLFTDLKGMPVLGMSAVGAFFLLFIEDLSIYFLVSWLVLMLSVYFRLQISAIQKSKKPNSSNYKQWTWRVFRSFMAIAVGWMTIPMLVLPIVEGWPELTFAFMMFVVITLPLPIFSSCFPLVLLNPLVIFAGTILSFLYFSSFESSSLVALFTITGGTVYLYSKYNRMALGRIEFVDHTRAMSVKQERLTELEKENVYDSITGLLNFIGFTKRYTEGLSEQSEAYIISVKIKDAQSYYASQYKDTADELLRSCALRLMSTKLTKEVVSHVGVGEFLIGGINEDSNQAKLRATAFNNAFKVNLRFQNKTELVQVSIGYAEYPATNATHENLPFHAMAAMNRAYNSGGRDVVLYSPTISDQLSNQLNISKAIMPALRDGEFEVYYQPKYQTDTQSINSAEALLRWNSSKFGVVSPVEFIPVAETNGDIIELGLWVLREAIDVLKSDQLPEDFSIAVNLSIKQLEDPALIDQLLSMMATLPEGRRLELELTESTLLTNDDQISDSLTRLAQEGISLALDDFGTGYSSLSYLSRIEVSVVKLDKSFIDPVLEDAKHQILVSSIIQLVQRLGLDLVAEGVENQSQLNWLIDNNCKIIQGYFIAKPLPKSHFYKLLAEPKTLILAS